MALLVAVAGTLVPVHSASGVADDPGGADTQLPGERLTEGAPPNIVILLLDDYPAMDSRVFERLPNIKNVFLDQGVLFDNYWANFSLCCPGRATLLTGQRAIHTGVRTNSALLFNPSVSLATELQGAGYRTMIFGKYLNNFRKVADKTPPGWDDMVIKDSGPYFEYPMWVNGVREYHGSLVTDYSTDVVASKSMPLIENAPANEPLFMFMTPNATHGGPNETGKTNGKQPVAAPRHRGDALCAGIPPWMPPNYNEPNVGDKPAYVRALSPIQPLTGWPLAPSCESLLSVDEWFGQVVDELKAQDRYDNTIFMLTQDNGMGWGAHRLVAKIAPYTAEMNLYVAWPSVLGGATAKDSTLLSNIDLAPTLCEIAGCEMGPFANGFGVDGRSFAGLIDPTSFTSVPERDSIIIENGDGGSVPAFRALLTGANHRRGRWLFVSYATSERELYNLAGGECWTWQTGNSGDPCMLTNVAWSRPNLRKTLAAELAAEW